MVKLQVAYNPLQTVGVSRQKDVRNWEPTMALGEPSFQAK